MLTLIVGREASGNRSSLAPLSNRNSLTPSTVVTIVGASFYNIFAELFGGVEVVIREEDQPVR